MTDYPNPPYPPPAQPQPGQPQPGQPHRTPTPWYRRTWVLIVATAVVALVIGVAAGGAEKDNTTADAADTTVTTTATTTSTAPAPPARTQTLQPTVVRTIATKTRTRTETYTPPPQPSFDDGTYEVGSDIDPGTFRTDGGEDCYYAVLKDVSGGLDNIVQNDNFSGQSIVKLKRGQYFQVSGGCEWRHN